MYMDDRSGEEKPTSVFRYLLPNRFGNCRLPSYLISFLIILVHYLVRL